MGIRQQMRRLLVPSIPPRTLAVEAVEVSLEACPVAERALEPGRVSNTGEGSCDDAQSDDFF